ncbi:acyl-CoA thioesterase [Calidifontibacter terrae]
MSSAQTPELDPVADLLDVLDLKPVGSTRFGPVDTADDPDADLHVRELEIFVGRSQTTPQGRAFGGQVLAQSLIAAGRSVQAVEGLGDRAVHSLHAYFIRPGDSHEPIRFAVENLRDGNSFSVRRVYAMQNGETLLSATLSFQAPAGGLDHQAPMPSVPDPDRVRTTAEELEGIDHPVADHWRSRAVDVRTVEGALFFKPGRQQNAAQNVWMKTTGALPDDALIHAAVMAYSSDYTLLESVLRRHGLVWSDRRLRPASLDHSMWFHRPGRVDEWLLYQQESPSASGGRGLGMGKMFSLDGTLLCTVAQEGMVRVKENG